MVLVPGTPDGVEVHQILCGREIARGREPIFQMAAQMANYIYLVIDARAGHNRDAVLIDGCWDVDGIMQICKDLSVGKISAAVYTHRHFDHTGAKQLPKQMTRGQKIELPGLHNFAEMGVSVGVGVDDLEAVAKQSGIDASQITALTEGHIIHVGDGGASLIVMNTPGHTHGSITFKLTSGTQAPLIITGDTLFIGACGRYDLPESDVRALLGSLDRLGKLPRDTLVLPGHNYAAPAHSTIGAESDTNDMMRQAMSLVKSGKISPSPVAAMLPLPDHLAVAERVADFFSSATPHAGARQLCCAFEDEGEGCDASPLPFFGGGEAVVRRPGARFILQERPLPRARM